jgi:CHAT domain-containing protein
MVEGPGPVTQTYRHSLLFERCRTLNTTLNSKSIVHWQFDLLLGGLVTVAGPLIFHVTASMSISDLDDWISDVQDILSSSPQTHPLRPAFVQALAVAYHNRYELSDQKQDVDSSILYYTQSIFFAFPWVGTTWSKDFIGVFASLAFELLGRWLHFKQSHDAECAIEYLRYLQHLPLETSGVSRDQVRVSLLKALGLQVEVGSHDVGRDVDEMTILCRELLDSNFSGGDLADIIVILSDSVDTNFNQYPESEPSEELIECLRKATQRFNSHHHHHFFAYSLAWLLVYRFRRSYSIQDYEEAMALVDEITASHSGGDSGCPGPCVEPASEVSAILVGMRYDVYGKPEYREEAIDRTRAFLSLTSTDNPLRLDFAPFLTDLVEGRSREFGVTDGLRACSINPEAVHLPSFSRLAASLAKSTSVEPLRSMSREEGAQYLLALASASHATDIADIEEAIKYCRQFLASLHQGDSFADCPAFRLGELLFRAFNRTKKIEYLNESIAILRDVFQSDARYNNADVARTLIFALISRFQLLLLRDDVDEIMQLFATAANHAFTTAPGRLELSSQWAQYARIISHPSTLTAYKTAISLMQDSLLFAPTLETQHFSLVASRDMYEKLPLDLASYQISKGQADQAVESLERGRALLWSEMRDFRAPIDQLSAEDPPLAEAFTAINRELETLTMSVTPGMAMDDPVGGGEGMDSFGRLVVQQQKLVAERNELVSRIQSLPGLRNFPTTLSFDTLRSAAVHGPIIIINHSKWRSDILILLHVGQPSLITTSDDFYNRAIELRNRLVRMRNKFVLESKQYQRALRNVLKILFELVGQPVIEELRRLKIPEQSRVWWCPTSVFCSLPLHAMGPLQSDDGVKRYFSDLYIPSYTPTLSALIESRKPGKSPLEKPSVLLVANPDDALRQAWPEIWFIQRLDTKVTTLLGKRATSSAVLGCLQDHRFAHFVCHGKLEPDKPFNAAFRLYGGNRLTLLDIVRSRLPGAEFAFLSACHTAELTEGSIADEGLHLTAAIQYCGFRSVVGTMWAMVDEDGGGLAEHFYNSMFSSLEPGVPYHERSARALRDAVQALRGEKRLPLEQWVNFVHYGA